ncbi:MAG: CPBP family intramembrane metalloprotease [Flavobacterium sp. JAD_PAG50586_2]|nr:MAG: CPBP family intramembrane metalloprotease [Flavobacterium sp. JAD_PAG50586_2]
MQNQKKAIFGTGICHKHKSTQAIPMNNEYSTNKRSMLLGILFCFSIFLCCTLLNPKTVFALLGLKKDYFLLLLISRLMQWFCLLLILLYALKIEKQDFLLWKNRSYKLPAFVLHVLLLYLAVVVTVIPIRILINLFELQQASKQLGIITSVMAEYPIMIPFVCITAGIVEEYVFRGYLQPRLEAVTKSPFLGILISAVLFGAGHYTYGTLDNVVVPFVIGLVFAVYYWKYRNIYTLIVCHTLIDLISISAMVYK